MNAGKDPSIHGPIEDPLTPYGIDQKMRYLLEETVFRLRARGLEGLASGTGDRQALIARARMTIPPETEQLFWGMVRDSSAYLLWRKHREIYDVHPAMSHSLLRLGSKSKIPGSVFRRLRHANPYIITSAGIPVTHADGHPGRILGFYVSGAINPDYPQVPGVQIRIRSNPTGGGTRASAPVDSYDKDANSLHVMVTSEVLDQAGEQVIDHDFCHLSIPMTTDFTLDDLIDEVATSGFLWATDMKAPRQEDREKPYLATMARLVVSHLLYACSRTVEIADSPQRTDSSRKKKGAVRASKQPSIMHRVGYRIGAKIEDSVRHAGGIRERGAATGFKMPPHIRAPHSHLYWVGPGRQEADIKFLDPIPVNMQGDEPDITTVHPMR